jgi:hypothetical protein
MIHIIAIESIELLKDDARIILLSILNQEGIQDEID